MARSSKGVQAEIGKGLRMDRVQRAVRRAMEQAQVDLEAEQVDGRDARVRFDQETLDRVAALHRDPRTRADVLEAVNGELRTAMEEWGRAIEAGDSVAGYRGAFVAVNLQERLTGVHDRRYVEHLDGTIVLSVDDDLDREVY